MQDEFKAAARKTALSVAAAACFGLGLNYAKSTTAALEFASGYLVEQSLSVDNLFVFIMLFDYFRVPREFQGRVLNWGILGAVAMRGVMIIAGVAAVQSPRGRGARKLRGPGIARVPAVASTRWPRTGTVGCEDS